jgi:hypothetical protein
MKDHSDHITQSLLERIIPFRFLSPRDKEELSELLTRHEFAPGDCIVRQGDTDDRKVYLLASGSVELADPRRYHKERLMTIEAEYYFGEWEPLFREPRVYEIRAIGPVVAYAMEGDVFLGLLQKSRAFAQSFGTILRHKQGVFAAFDRFKIEIVRAVSQGHINITRLVPMYRELNPALHAGAVSDSEIDFNGLTYTVRRLPENVTRTFAYLLLDEFPDSFPPAHELFKPIATEARRREIWEIITGKSMIVLRTGLSDLTDFVTCLCLYAVEARKIRKRLQSRESIRALHQFVCVPETRTETEEEFLRRLSFTDSEIRGLYGVWPEDAVHRIYDIVRHREMFNIDVRRQQRTYNSHRNELWTHQIAGATREVLGFDPSELPAELPVHVVSSNSHSVANCLNPWFSENEAELMEFAHRSGSHLLDQNWENTTDCLYAVAREYFDEYPEAFADLSRRAAQAGIMPLKETASTGIQVQLIDLSRLALGGIDPGIRCRCEGKPEKSLIVNIDYAFGEQAEQIIRNLLMLFGRRLKSISFFGKAGALLGKRGDILVPTAFIHQSTDHFLPLPVRDPDAEKRLGDALPGRQVHHGPMLTVEGTLLQNTQMLHFYREIWGCVGLEMEGAHYFRQIQESMELGVLDSTVDLGFYYYVSDLPAKSDSLLSAPLRAWEGIPPLYAITREILGCILS